MSAYGEVGPDGMVAVRFRFTVSAFLPGDATICVPQSSSEERVHELAAEAAMEVAEGYLARTKFEIDEVDIEIVDLETGSAIDSSSPDGSAITPGDAPAAEAS